LDEIAVTVERTDAREWSDEQMADLFSEGFPPFITADKLAAQYIGRVREWFPEWNLILVDAEQNPAATGWGIPVRWDSTVTDLPTGYTDATIRAVEGREQGIAADTLVICGAVVAGRQRYPLTPVETFMTWTRPDGSALDPWIRTQSAHERVYPGRRPRLADHDRYRRRMGTVVRHRTAVQRRLRHPARPERAARRPRGRPGHLCRAEHLDPPPLI
jgi:hypothetical protein